MSWTLKHAIFTPRLKLRPCKEDDFATLLEIYQDSDVMRFIRNGVRTREQAQAELNCYIRDWEYQDWGMWGVELRGTDKILGTCGFSGRSSIGYIFAKAAWGKGYATEAAFATLYFGFMELHREEIGGGALLANESSLNILRKVGMAPVKNDFFDQNGGAYFSISRHEYQQMPETGQRVEKVERIVLI